MSDASKTTDLRLVYDRDAEIDRILSMSDDEILAETIAEGLDPEQVASECRDVLRRALAAVRGVQNV